MSLSAIYTRLRQTERHFDIRNISIARDNEKPLESGALLSFRKVIWAPLIFRKSVTLPLRALSNQGRPSGPGVIL